MDTRATSNNNNDLDLAQVILGQLRRIEDTIVTLADEVAARKNEEQQAQEPHTYTIQQAAERLAVSYGVIRGWIRDGVLPAFDVSRTPDAVKRRLRVRRGDLEAFMLVSAGAQNRPVMGALKTGHF